MLNNIRQSLSFDDVKRYTDEINKHLEDMPAWKDRRSQIAHARYSVSLRQYLLIIHDRQIKQAETITERSFSRMILFDAARNIVKTHRKLIKNGIYALEVLCNDQLRAALSITRLATTLDPTSDCILNGVVDQEAAALVEDVVEMLTDRVNRFGREQRQLWLALSAHGFLKTKKDPSRRAAYMQEAVDKVTQPYYKIMACQEDVPSVPSLSDPSTVRSGPQEEDPQPSHQIPTGPAAKTVEVDGLEIPLLDMDEIAAWTFEDWSFDPDDLYQQQSGYGVGYNG